MINDCAESNSKMSVHDYIDEHDYYHDVADDNSDILNDTDDHDIVDDYRPAKQVAPFSILTENAIQQRQDAAIENVAVVLSVSRTRASLLLRNFEWSVSKVHEEWFADEAGVRARLGILDEHDSCIKPTQRCIQAENIGKAQVVYCGICLEYHPFERMRAAAPANCHCDHFFCVSCWGEYAHTSISNGPGCLSLRCPHPGCKTAVEEELIMSVVSEEDKQKYRRYVLRSYVEANRRAKWCPAPGCEHGVELNPDQSYSISNLPDVTCVCGYAFCWSCCEEAHRPVECATVAKWIAKNSLESKNSSESKNTAWLLLNSKPCPKCKRPIEKSTGCMHMTCLPPCRFEFCWLCLKDWRKHDGGGVYECNRYEEEMKLEGKSKRKRAEARPRPLDRYTHYYERWASNGTSRAMALGDLQKMQANQMEKLMDRYSLPPSQLKFITEAWLQIVECRQVLRWTYAYGYLYLPEREVAKKQFFEYLQGEAEAALERLHRCAERDMEVHLQQNIIIDDGHAAVKLAGTCSSFVEFSAKLTGLTTITRNYFHNFVKALENGLADVALARSSSMAPAGAGADDVDEKSSKQITD